MKNKLKKTLSIILSALIVFSGTGVVVYALSEDENQTGTSSAEAAVQSEVISDSETTDKVIKDETVYVVTDAEGSAEKVIVSDWIKNGTKEEQIKDKSELSDVEVTKGDTQYTLDGENMRIWDAKGQDVFYRGKTDKTLPVEVKASYKLDGKDITAKDLGGKSGKVTVRFNYTNNQSETVTINGKEETIYVPFAMLTGMVLDNEKFTDIKVTNGKIVNDGTHTTVVGFAFPKMQENLNIDKDVLAIPDYVEITADVKDFALETTVTVATNQLFNEVKTDGIASVGDLSESMGSLTKGMSALIDGSSKLYDGIDTLLEKSGDLVSGIDKLYDGAEQLKTGAGSLGDGASKIQAGAEQLYGGLATLTSKNDQLNGGAKQTFQALLSTATDELNNSGLTVPTLTMENYDSVLQNVIDSLDSEKVLAQIKEAVSQKVNSQRPQIEAQVTQAVRAEVEKKVVLTYVLSQQQLTVEQYEQLPEEQKALIDQAVAQALADENTKAALAPAVDQQMESEDIKATISAKTDETVNAVIDQTYNALVSGTYTDDPALQQEVTTKIAAAENGLPKVSGLKASLDSFNDFYQGLLAYTGGVASAKDGAGELQSGAEQLQTGAGSLADGADELYKGIGTLKDKTPQLVDGIKQLKDGSMSLSDGLEKFNKDGIQKLVEAVDGDLEGLVDRLDAVAKVSRNYKSFAGISDDMDGNVKFVFRSEAIEAEVAQEESKEN